MVVVAVALAGLVVGAYEIGRGNAAAPSGSPSSDSRTTPAMSSSSHMFSQSRVCARARNRLVAFGHRWDSTMKTLVSAVENSTLAEKTQAFREAAARLKVVEMDFQAMDLPPQLSRPGNPLGEAIILGRQAAEAEAASLFETRGGSGVGANDMAESAQFRQREIRTLNSMSCPLGP